MSNRTRKKERMKRVALIANTTIPVPPHSGGGGAETIVYGLALELIQRGVDVTVYCANGSHIPGAEVICLGPAIKDNSLGEYIGVNFLHAREAYHLLRQRDDIDLVHTHNSQFEPFAGLIDKKVLSTIHNGGLYGEGCADFPVTRAALSATHQRLLAEKGIRTEYHVYNGLNFDHLVAHQPSPRGQKLAYLGRMTPEKGPDLAARLAIGLGWEIVIAAPAFEERHRSWYEEVMQPLLDHRLVTYVGPISEEEKDQFFEGVYALVMANRGWENPYGNIWIEPSGLVHLEALIRGVTVIGPENGAIPGIVGDAGVFLPCITSDDQAVVQMALNLHRLADITPEQCKARAMQFSTARMAEAYIKVYQEMLAR
jgi:glycosyltransferase involved in cell wall biosynthesis